MSSPKHFLYKLISKALGSVEFTLNKDLKEKGHVSQLFPSGLHTNAHDLGTHEVGICLGMQV